MQALSIPSAILYVASGGALGAVLRWLIGLGLNAVFPLLPPGTLLANLLGAYLMGLVLAVLGAPGESSEGWRLFLATGFLGGLTTFSTFTAEITGLLAQQRYLWALGGIALHVLGSLAMLGLGLATVGLLRGQ